MKWLLWLLVLLSTWPIAPKAGPLTVVSDRLMAPVVRAWLKDSGLEAEHRIANALTAVQQLIQGRAEVIAIGRPLSDEERRQLRPSGRVRSLPVGIDAVALYVPRHSPLTELTLAQLARWFGTRPCHRHRAGAPAAAPPARFGLSPAVAGHHHFVHLVLCGAPLQPGVILLNSDLELIEAVARNRGAIGFASAALGAETALRPVALKRSFNSRAYLPSRRHLESGRYPLTHFLYLHLTPTSAGARALARFALTPRGQVLLGRRFVTLPKPARIRALESLLR